MKSSSIAVGLSLFAVLGATARAQQTVLFGRTWHVQRFDYFQSVRFTDPKQPSATIGLLDAESATCIAPDRLVIASRQMDLAPNQSYENFVVEVRVDANASGSVTGLSYVRTIVVNDPRPAPTGLGSAFDLDPKGVSINTGTSGVGANGNLLVGEGQQNVRAYSLATGALLSLGFSCDPPNNDLEDCCYVPDASGTSGRIYTLDQSGQPRMEVFSTSGASLGGFGVGTSASPPATSGAPKALAWLADVATYPPMFRGLGGVVLVALDDTGPALQAFTRNGTLVAQEALSAAVFVPGSQPLNIEAIAVDPVYGRLFLVQQGTNGVNDFLWVLSPDCNGNGIADAHDIEIGASFDVNLDGEPDECQIPGIAFCFGDGTGAACPCGNASSFGSNTGCANSLGLGGALSALGFASIAHDSLMLQGSGLPNSSALYFQGTLATNGGMGSAFGDGLRCASGSIVRLGTKTNQSGTSRYPASGDARISVKGLATAGATRRYQVWYRNAANFCQPETFNLTNGWEIVWQS